MRYELWFGEKGGLWLGERGGGRRSLVSLNIRSTRILLGGAGKDCVQYHELTLQAYFR